METDHNFKITFSSNTLSIYWKGSGQDYSFDFSFQVLWRGITIPVYIKKFKNRFGNNTEITFQYTGNLYVTKFTWNKYFSGRRGVLPEIKIATHKLCFCVDYVNLEIIESFLEPT